MSFYRLYLSTLNPRTLMFATAVSLLVTSTAMVLGGLLNRRTSGVLWMVIGYLMIAVGVGLLATQGYIPLLFSIYFANLITLGGIYVTWMGIRLLQQKPVIARYYWLTGVVLVAILFAVLGQGESNYWLRTLFFFLIAGSLSLLMSRELLVAQQPNITDIYTGVLFVLLAVAFWVRATQAAMGHKGGSLMEANGHTIATYLAVLVINLLLAYGITMMLTERVQQRLRNLADTDYLTGLKCRRAFVEQAERVLARARKDRYPVSMLLLDIDDFKRINDTYGHAAGDKVLSDFAANIAEFFRVTDILGRIGGEEFGILLTHVEQSQATATAERLRRVFEASLVDIDGRVVQAKVSIGVASSHFGDIRFEDLYNLSDKALYEAKKSGKNCVRVVTAAEAMA